MGEFFTSKNDVDLGNNIIKESVDFYVHTEGVAGKGVVNSAIPATTTITDAELTLVADAEIGKTILLNGLEYIIDDNDVTSITIDTSTDAITDGLTLDYRVINKEEFFGWVDNAELTADEETMEFKTGIPRQKIREDLLERIVSCSGEVRTQKFGLMKAVFNLSDKSDTGFYIGTAGSNPASRPFYKFVMKNRDVSGKNRTITLFRNQIKPNGAIPLGNEEYKIVPFMISVLADNLRQDPASITQDDDMFEISIEK